MTCHEAEGSLVAKLQYRKEASKRVKRLEKQLFVKHGKRVSLTSAHPRAQSDHKLDQPRTCLRRQTMTGF